MDKQNTMRRRLLVIPFAFMLAVSLLFPSVTYAALPYMTNYRGSDSVLVWMQAAYAPDKILGIDIVVPDPENPDELKESNLSMPKDLFIDDNDTIYIADSGNNRIVVLNPDGTFQRIITVDESPLSNPQGLFVDKAGNIYVADTGNARVVMIDQNGNLLKEYVMPDDGHIPSDYRFEPVKVAVDKRGYMYIVSLGQYHGLLQLDPDGGFSRFFGTNETPSTLMDSLKKIFYTRAMLEKQARKIPPAITNIAIDEQGFVYTVSHGQEMTSKQVKKLNFKGNNFLGSGSEYGSGNNRYGEFRFAYKDQKPVLADIAIDELGNFTVIDSSLKFISQYDAFGNLLFFFAGTDDPSRSSMTPQMGIVQSPSAIDVDSEGRLYILDSYSNMIQVFRLTEFGKLIHTANRLTVDGRYEEAKPYWEQVLHLNAYYTPAVMGLAQAAYRAEDYALARDLFYEARNQTGYSNSFWQLRLVWFQQNFSMLMNIIIIVGAIYYFYPKIARRLGWSGKLKPKKKITHPLWIQLKHAFYLLRHPIDGFTALRYENKGSYLSSIIIMIVAFVSMVLSEMWTSFSFNPNAGKYIDIATMFGQFIVLFMGWVISNYLVSSVMRGEGRFKDVFMGTAYSLMPLILVGLPLAIISNGMTQSEEAIYSFLHQGMYIWMALLIFWQVQNLQNYSVGETAANIIVSMLTMGLLAIVIFLLFGLFVDLRDFVYSIFQEVAVR